MLPQHTRIQQQHVSLECFAYEDILHDFQKFLESCTGFEEVLIRTEPSLTTLDMFFACVLNQRTKLWYIQSNQF